MSLIKHFDYVGMILYSGSTSAVILGLSWGGQRYRKSYSQCVQNEWVLTYGLEKPGIRLMLSYHWSLGQSDVLPSLFGVSNAGYH